MKPGGPQPRAAAELAPVTFSVPGGVYRSNVVVTLGTTVKGATIHYSLDGSEPSQASGVYSAPLVIGESAVVKARAVARGQSSPVTGETYVLLDPSLETWSSNLPVIILNTFGHEIQREEPTAASIRILEPKPSRTTLTNAAHWDSRALVGLRGHTSLRYPKRSYRVKLCAADNSSLKAGLFDFPKDADWVLYAPYSDKTLIRDVLAYELSNQMGRYAPRTQFVELFVNRAGGKLASRDYMGVFVLIEKIKPSPGRVAIEKISSEDNTEPAISGGYLFKKDHLDRVDPGPPNIGGFPNGGGAPTINRDGFPTGPGGFPGDPKGFLPAQGNGDDGNEAVSFRGRDRWLNGGEGFLSPTGTQFLFSDPGPDEITEAQRRWLSRYVRQLESALASPEFRDPAKGYAAYLDADSFIDHHWLIEATKNIDGFRFSTYYHKDRNGKLKMGPIWDWNLSFGAPNGKQGFMAEYWYWPQLDNQQYSWFRRLFEDPDFAQKYVDRWGELRTNQFAIPRILARIDELATQLNEAQARNYRRWRILGRQVWPNNYTGKTYADEVQYLKNWISQRLSWIDRQFVAGPALSESASSPNAARLVTLRSSKGKVYYTIDGTDPRASGGAISPSAHLYRAPVSANHGAVVMARVLDGKRWSWPVRAE